MSLTSVQCGASVAAVNAVIRNNDYLRSRSERLELLAKGTQIHPWISHAISWTRDQGQSGGSTKSRETDVGRSVPELAQPDTAACVFQHCRIIIFNQAAPVAREPIVEKNDFESIVVHQERAQAIDLVP